MGCNSRKAEFFGSSGERLINGMNGLGSLGIHLYVIEGKDYVVQCFLECGTPRNYPGGVYGWVI